MNLRSVFGIFFIWIISSIASAADLVIVMHGMGRTSLSMLTMEWYLEEQGFEVDNWNYDGFFSATSELADQLTEKLKDYESKRPDARIHIVSHSLGGIIARLALSQRVPSNFGRLLQLTPPNQGAQTATRAAPFVNWLLRPIEDLRADESALVRNIPRLHGVEVGVIKGKNDWLVSPDEADLPEAKFIIEMDTSHSFVMANSKVQTLTRDFLLTGKVPINVPEPEPSRASP